jgi:hypothetical protein
MKIAKFGTLLAAMAVLPLASVQAQSVRPGIVALPVAGKSVIVSSGVRTGAPVKKTNDLLGLPVVFLALGAVAITIGTIVIVDNGNSSSPGG